MGVIPKAQAMNEHRQIRLHEKFKICVLKDNINRVKMQTTEWRKIFSNYISDKGLMSKINKKFLTSTTTKNNRFKNGQRT